MEGVLFVSRKCPHSNRLLSQFPNMPRAVAVIDVHDPRARKFLVSYHIQAVPSLVVLAPDGRSRVFSARGDVARTLAAFGEQEQEEQRPPQRKNANANVQREGVDPQGPFPEVQESTGPSGWNDCGAVLDVAELYGAPGAKVHSMQGDLMARASADQRPNSKFEPPLPPQQPLMPAGQTARPDSASTISSDEMNRKLEEMARMRTEYDKNVEARNLAMSAQNRTLR